MELLGSDWFEDGVPINFHAGDADGGPFCQKDSDETVYFATDLEYIVVPRGKVTSRCAFGWICRAGPTRSRCYEVQSGGPLSRSATIEICRQGWLRDWAGRENAYRERMRWLCMRGHIVPNEMVLITDYEHALVNAPTLWFQDGPTMPEPPAPRSPIAQQILADFKQLGPRTPKPPPEVFTYEQAMHCLAPCAPSSLPNNAPAPMRYRHLVAGSDVPQLFPPILYKSGYSLINTGDCVPKNVTASGRHSFAYTRRKGSRPTVRVCFQMRKYGSQRAALYAVIRFAEHANELDFEGATLLADAFKHSKI